MVAASWSNPLANFNLVEVLHVKRIGACVKRADRVRALIDGCPETAAGSRVVATVKELVSVWGGTLDLDQAVELFDEIPVFLNVVEGPEFRVVMTNRQVRESPAGSSVLGKCLADIYPGDTPIRKVLERVYASGIAETVHDQPAYYPDNAYAGHYFTRSFVPLKEGPSGAKRIMVMVYEVTETVQARLSLLENERRNEAERKRLYALLEEAPVPISVLEGPELRMVMTNRLKRERLGLRVALGTAFRDLVASDNETLAAAHRVYATGVAESFETIARDIDGFIGRSFAVTMVPIRGADGAVTHVMSATVETTEHHRARDKLEIQARDLDQARRKAIEATRAKDQFLAALSHELRNPLAPMLTSVQVLRTENATSPALEILERQVRHMTRLVDDLLDISRITRGQIVLNRKELELATVVNRALETTSPLLEKRGHRVVTDMVHGSLGVLADPDRLEQVLANLVTNAAKYSDPGSQIRISARREGDRVKLSVSDDGAGISSDMLGRVFDAFVQQSQTLDHAQGGLGLGLAIVKGIVEAHGGCVTARSDGIGRGSTFVVELPALAVGHTPAEITAPFVPIEPERAAAVRILVVDDNRDAADILTIALEGRGHKITIAYDGPSALEIAAANPPQLALVDLGLPGMDGYRLAEALRATYAIPVVAITGFGQEADRKRTSEAGFAAHLVKPVDFNVLAALVQQLAPSTVGT
jgi:signal transduction histidine kinase